MVLVYGNDCLLQFFAAAVKCFVLVGYGNDCLVHFFAAATAATKKCFVFVGYGNDCLVHFFAAAPAAAKNALKNGYGFGRSRFGPKSFLWRYFPCKATKVSLPFEKNGQKVPIQIGMSIDIAIGIVFLILFWEGPGPRGSRRPLPEKKNEKNKANAMLMPILFGTYWYFFSK